MHASKRQRELIKAVRQSKRSPSTHGDEVPFLITCVLTYVRTYALTEYLFQIQGGKDVPTNYRGGKPWGTWGVNKLGKLGGNQRGKLMGLIQLAGGLYE